MASCTSAPPGNQRSPSGSGMSPSRLLIQIMPFTLLGLLSSALGAWIWSYPATPGSLLLRILLLLLSFLGLLALKRTSTWNVVLLVLFGVLAGSFFVFVLPNKDQITMWLPSLVTTSLLMASYLAANRLPGRVREIGAGLWILTWFYVLGWVGLLMVEVDPLLKVIWACFGLALFSGMSMVWLSNLPAALQILPGSALGIDLYLITINLYIASHFLFSLTG